MVRDPRSGTSRPTMQASTSRRRCSTAKSRSAYMRRASVTSRDPRNGSRKNLVAPTKHGTSSGGSSGASGVGAPSRSSQFGFREPNSDAANSTERDTDESVLWIPAPGRGYATDLICYLSPPSIGRDPALSTRLPGRLLVSMPLSDHRWFSVVAKAIPAPSGQIEPIRRNMIARVRAEMPNYRAAPSDRGIGIMQPEKEIVGLVELRPARA